MSDLDLVHEQLQSSEQRRLIDTIDELRSEGISDINLPQLIVCGDQSSGKSSVLNAITRLKFPWHENVCTTFATEIILRRGPAKPSGVSIIPGPRRTKEQKKKLEAFTAEFKTNDEFAKLIKEAKARMMEVSEAGEKTIFDDKLRVTLTGPKHTTLTVVDLPGIIHNPNEGQNEDDMNRIYELVRTYMENPRSVILAIISAENAIELQKILSISQEPKVDPRGLRTFGIITKPDLIKASPEFKKSIMDLAKNERKRYQLTLGWHVVRNRSFEETDFSDAARDSAERKFFQSGDWASHPKEWTGVDALCRRLQKFLLHQIRLELPGLIKELEEKRVNYRARLDRLGESRETSKELRAYLTGISQQFQILVKAAINGHYDEDFFELSQTETNSKRRLCAALQASNRNFISAIETMGCRWCLTLFPGSSSRNPALDAFYGDVDMPEDIHTRDLAHIVAKLKAQSTKRELLPNSVSGDTVKELFNLQARNWGTIAKCYVKSIYEDVTVFMEELLAELTDSETSVSIMHEFIEPHLAEKRKEIWDKVDELLSPQREKYPIIYSLGLEPKQYDLEEQDERRGEYTIIAQMELYYKLTMAMFINNVASLAIENCLIKTLPSFFSPLVVHDFSDEMLERLAGESEDIRVKRKLLASKLKEAERGLELLEPQFRRALRETKQKASLSEGNEQDEELKQTTSSITSPQSVKSDKKATESAFSLKSFSFRPSNLNGTQSASKAADKEASFLDLPVQDPKRLRTIPDFPPFQKKSSPKPSPKSGRTPKVKLPPASNNSGSTEKATANGDSSQKNTVPFSFADPLPPLFPSAKSPPTPSPTPTPGPGRPPSATAATTTSDKPPPSPSPSTTTTEAPALTFRLGKHFSFPAADAHPAYALPCLPVNKYDVDYNPKMVSAYQSISMHELFENLSHEELRVRDYEALRSYLERNDDPDGNPFEKLDIEARKSYWMPAIGGEQKA